MYINDISIVYYVVVGIIGIIAGFLVDWANIRLPEYKKVFSKDIFNGYFKSKKINYIGILIVVFSYISLLFYSRIDQGVLYQIDFWKYVVIVPMLLIVFDIDYRLQIIPNRLNLAMFEIGMIFAFITGLFEISIAINMILGMFTGAGIFLFITLIGGLIAGKEAMGFGDVKLMGALGLFFGVQKIIGISVVSFLIAAVISIFILILRKNKADGYIPFGPFIVIATFVIMFIPFDVIINILFKIFTLGLY